MGDSKTKAIKKLSTKNLSLKTNYAVKQQWAPFYTGGNVCVSSDGVHLFCMCGEKVQILNIETGLVEKEIQHDEGDVKCFGLSPDNTMLVTATKSLLLKQWAWQEEVKCVRTWKAIHLYSISCMDFDLTSTLLATGGSDGSIKVWDLIRQYCTHDFKGSRGVISALRFHPSNLTLYSASDDYHIRVWDLKTSRCIGLMESHVSAVTTLKFLSEDTFISGGRDSVVSIWNVLEKANPEPVKPKKTIPIFEIIEDVVILPHDESYPELKVKETTDEEHFYFMTAGDKGVLRVWDSKTGKCMFSNNKTTEETTTNIGYTHLMSIPNLDQIIAVTDDHRIDFMNTNGLECSKHLVGYNDDILDLKFLGTDESYMVVATNSPNIKVFKVSSSSCQILKGHTDTVLCVGIFPSKLDFVSSSKDNTVRLWKMDPETNLVQCMAVGSGHTHAVTCVAACKLGLKFFVSGSEDQTLKIWSVSTVKNEQNIHIEHTIPAHSQAINSAVISPNDKLIATGSQDKTAKLWSAQSGKQLGTFKGHKRGIWCVQFSPMDQVLGSSSADGTIKLWSLTDFTCLKTLEGHDCSVLKLIFVAKGTQIITTGSDGLLKLWTVKSSECVQTMDEHSDKTWALCSNSNDDLLLSGSTDSVIIVWEDVSELMRNKAVETHQTTVLQHQELQNLLHEKRFEKALHLAIRLAQPFTALNVVKEILWEEDGDVKLGKYLDGLRLDQKQMLFKFAVNWNTNSRNCHEAQAILRIILSTSSPQEIEEFPDSQTTIEGLIPYTNRHFQRISKVAQQATFLDYTWSVMKMTPQDMN